MAGQPWGSFTNIFTQKDNEELILVNGPAYKVVTKYNGYVLKASSNAQRNSGIFMLPKNNAQDENWELIPSNKEGSFYLVSAYSGLLAAEPKNVISLIPHESDHKGRERLLMEPVPNEPGWYYIKYMGSGYYFALSGTGANSNLLSVKNKVSNDQGKFRFEKAGDVVWTKKVYPSTLTAAPALVENNRYQVSGQPEQYRYNNGQFRWIPDMETLIALKLDSKPLIQINYTQQIGMIIGAAYLP